uniref:Protein bicaudal D n=1 Tax=Plectus sambesii TaxID=2011161 RepID=A0A914UQX9_9BILA
MAAELEELRLEIVRLSAALEEASAEKIQAAQYGLQVLEDKQQVEQRYLELEGQLDTVRHELDTAREALAQFQTQQKVASKSDIEHEDSILAESASREAELTAQISSLETELRTTQQELMRKKSEIERLQSMHTDASQTAEDLDSQKKHLRDELKELKMREQRLLNDYSELEEENITLQKQVSSLKSAQVEFESMKYEVKRLLDETDVLQSATVEANELRSIAEKQVEEALMSLQQEREQRLALKKELDQLKNAEHLSQLNSMFMGLSGLGAARGGDDDDGDNPGALRQLESSFTFSAPDDKRKGGDLFSEIHGDLHGQLAELEKEKSELEARLNAQKGSLPPDTLEQIARVLRALQLIDDQKQPTPDQLKDLLASATDQIQKLRERFAASNSDETEQQLKKQTAEVAALQADLKVLGKMAGDTQSTLACAQDMMIGVSETLAQLYHHVMMVQGKTPDRAMLEHMRAMRDRARENADTANLSLVRDASEAESGTDTETGRGPRVTLSLSRPVLSEKFLQSLHDKLHTNLKTSFSEQEMREQIKRDGPIFHVADTVTDQLKYLKKAMESALDSHTARAMEGEGDQSSLAIENEELQHQNVKLRSLLSTKREQIATLRTVLKSNKVTAESALASLKEKYESEKIVSAETIDRLRRELKAFKEDAATFASHRAMFTARSEEFQAQVEELQAQVKAADDEKKTLNSLLRMAIQQKLALTQRLEDLEMDRERQTFRRGSRPQRGGAQQDQGPPGHPGVYVPPRAVRYPITPGSGAVPRQNAAIKRDY